MATKKAWEGRFKEKNDQIFEKMNRSLSFDIRMFREDILLNKAWSKQLARLGFLKEEELSKIINGLSELEKDIEQEGENIFTQDIEDIHMGIETILTNKIGDVAKKIHFGKSRNDQVASDVRLYLYRQSNDILVLLKTFMQSFVNLAEKNITVIMPGFTHLRQAQPLLLSHYLMSFFFSLQRDYARLVDCQKRILILPLGSAALAGSSLSIDREVLLKDMGFESLSENSIDAVLSRDFILEFLSNISILSITLSRFAEDFIIFSSENFNFFELSDKVSTGSSIMPNKKNPDSLELTRGKTGRIIGNFISLFTVLKGIPSTYNKDLQEDKESLFDTIDTITETLFVSKVVLDTLTVNTNVLKDSINSLSFATELADYLAATTNVPFREGHFIVGKIVRFCIEHNTKLTDLREIDLLDFSEHFKGIGDNWGTIDNFLRKRELRGGTGTNSVVYQIKIAKEFLDSLSSN